MINNNIEILAPAGNTASFEAAIKAGANAVYLGGKNFSARAGADNFSEQDLIDVVEYAHLRNAKVYVTINTLLDDSELRSSIEFSKFLYEIGVDGIIIQDLGYFHLLNKSIKGIEKHASTQMSVNNIYGAKEIEEMGFDRLVIARETELYEIKMIKNQTNLSVEAFIHGALCVSFSGQCLFSSMIGARSGNRGNCAQACRKKYKIIGLDSKLLSNDAYYLSPKDLSLLDKIEDFVGLGVDSIKIEGRLKSPEYVYKIVSSYKNALENNLKEEDKLESKQIFNRGQTEGLAYGDFGRSYISSEKANNRGILIGQVVEKSKSGVFIDLKADINKGDGIEFDDGNYSQGFKIDEDIKKNKKSFIKSKRNISIGSKVYRTFSKNLDEKIKDGLNQNKKYRPISMDCILKLDQDPKLKVSSADYQETVSLDKKITKARKISLDKEQIMESLNKLGDSIYYLDEINIDIDEDIFISKSDLNKLRRKAIEKLDENFIEKRQEIKIDENIFKLEKEDRKNQEKKNLNVEVFNYQDLLKIDLEKVDKIYYPATSIDEDVIDFVKNTNKKISLVLPKFQNYKQLEASYSLYKNNKEYFEEVVFNNLANINIFKNENINKVADIGLNCFNSYSVKYLLNLGIDRIILSPELNKNQIQKIAGHYGKNLEVFSHGLLPVMTMRHCPMSTVLNCKDSSRCNQCKFSKGFYLEDSRKEKFLVRRNDDISELFNSHPIMFGDKIKDLNLANFKISLNSDIKESIDLYYNIINNKKFDQESLKNKLVDRYGAVSFGHLNRGII